jgi:hypothetical protein
MNPLLETILNSGGGGAVQQLSRQFGIDESQAQSAIGALLPALMGGIQNNVQQDGGLDGLLGALASGHHQQYIDDPNSLGAEATSLDGSRILGHILGNMGGFGAQEQVAAYGAQRTGLDQGMLMQMLPIVASLVMGALSKQSSQSNLHEVMQTQGQGGVMGILGGMLDQNQDGSIVDDVLRGVMGGLFRR